jgi:hypothetical protein
MINEQVLAYIRAELAQGVSREAIKKALSTGGWSETDMTEAFGAIDGVKKPTPPPPPPPAPMRPVSISPVRQPVPSISTISSAPVMERRRKVWPLVLLLFILILLGVAAAAYFLYPSLLARYIPGMAPVEPEVPSLQPPQIFVEPPLPIIETPATSTTTEGTPPPAATTTSQ